jgi:hypothetical protein
LWNDGKSQAWILPLLKRCGDEPASALAQAHAPVQFDEVLGAAGLVRVASIASAGGAMAAPSPHDLLDARWPLETSVGRDRAIEEVFVLAVTLLVRSHAFGLASATRTSPLSRRREFGEIVVGLPRQFLKAELTRRPAAAVTPELRSPPA